MLVEIAIAIVTVAVYWYYHLRIPLLYSSVRTVKLDAVTAPSASAWDYVIVGGGVSGAAAARAICVADPSARVLLVERGKMREGGMVAIPSMTTELIGSEVDQLIHVAAAFTSPSAADVGDSGTSPQKPAKVLPYPMGRGIGGTQQLDWSLLFDPAVESIKIKCGREALTHGLALLERIRRLKSSLPVCRSPLSWAFGEAAKCHPRVVGAHLPDEENIVGPTGDLAPVLKVGHVSPHLVWMEHHYGTRPNISRSVIDEIAALHCSDAKGGTFAVLQAASVSGFESSDCDEGSLPTPQRRKVTAVVLRDSLGSARKIVVRKAVVCCAGNFGSCRLASALIPNREWPSFPLVDSIAVPLVYQARAGLSDDPENAHSLKQMFAWYTARRGMFLNVVSDTSVVLPSALYAGGSVLVTLFPAAGYTRHRYAKLGFSQALGVFKEAFYFRIAVHTLPGVHSTGAFHFIAATSAAPGALSSLSFEGVCRGASDASARDAQRAASEVIQKMLIEGIQFCRELVALSPLAKLSTQKEALDTTLLPREEGKSIFHVLYANTKKTKNIDARLAAKIRERAVEVANSESYLVAYVQRHARYSGFASGSLADAVEPHGWRLKHVDNLFIGDASALPGARSCADGLHNAGSTATALLCGTVAGLEAASAMKRLDDSA